MDFTFAPRKNAEVGIYSFLLIHDVVAQDEEATCRKK
ncbi:hypothetical protein BofuT4_uP089140.1 [Botrytis cinerea T4]|uniref:Uncharacterized protein n=1 Tax=Botryotinia fuckeliana (strain T4) TaxID=999810 RepID=G2YFG7_BOTF4|nr:hypothetical protein BofuT4_uP089140.1 [Botrytis cinerea T4]